MTFIIIKQNIYVQEDLYEQIGVVLQVKDQLMVESLYKNLEQRIVASPPGICPVDITRAFIEMCHADLRKMCSCRGDFIS